MTRPKPRCPRRTFYPDPPSPNDPSEWTKQSRASDIRRVYGAGTLSHRTTSVVRTRGSYSGRNPHTLASGRNGGLLRVPGPVVRVRDRLAESVSPRSGPPSDHGRPRRRQPGLCVDCRTRRGAPGVRRDGSILVRRAPSTTDCSRGGVAAALRSLVEDPPLPAGVRFVTLSERQLRGARSVRRNGSTARGGRLRPRGRRRRYSRRSARESVSDAGERRYRTRRRYSARSSGRPECRLPPPLRSSPPGFRG